MIARQTLLLALVFQFGHVGIELRQLGGAHQNFLLARSRVGIPQLALLAFFVALHERKLRAIRTPLGRLRTSAC